MKKHASSFDFILDAVSAEHDINAYLSLLKLDGTLALVGLPENPLPVAPFNLLLPRRNFSGSAIGGIAETQETLDFCGEHEITSDIEMIKIQDINTAYERMLKGDVKYRSSSTWPRSRANRSLGHNASIANQCPSRSANNVECSLNPTRILRA
jgi:uncharacterized zinc-type alcohol dehydrogenase-like protein